MHVDHTRSCADRYFLTLQTIPRYILCFTVDSLAGGSSPMKAALEKFGFNGCKDADLEPVFTYLEFCLKQVSCCRPPVGRHVGLLGVSALAKESPYVP